MTEIILKDGTFYSPSQEDCIIWQRTYPNCDVHSELLAMASWSDANPSKRKTRTGAKRFVNGWLNKANQGNGSPLAKNGPKSTRSMTMDEMLNDRDWAS